MGMDVIYYTYKTSIFYNLLLSSHSKGLPTTPQALFIL